MRVENLRLPNGAASGLVLTSDSSGNGTWQPASAVASPEVNISTDGPLPRVGETLWVDTDDNAPAYLTTQPRVELRQMAAMGLTTGVEAKIPWDTEISDNYGMHDNAVNPNRVTIPAGMSGMYMVSVMLWYASNATSARYTRIYKSGIDAWSEIRQGSTGGVATIVALTALLALSVDDYIEVSAYQNSGGALQVLAGTPYFTMVRVST